MVAPRHHPFTSYLYAPEQRRSIIVIKQDSISAKERDEVSMLKREEYPFQCELVMEQLPRSEKKLVYDEDEVVSIRMAQAFGVFNDTTQISRLEFTNGSGVILESRPEQYSILIKKLEKKISSQSIDLYGKTRVLWINPKAETGDVFPIFVMPLPIMYAKSSPIRCILHKTTGVAQF